MDRTLLGLLICVQVLTFEANASVRPTNLNQLAGKAELIVLGSIRAEGIGAFSFDIEEVVAGDAGARQLEVRKFKDWTCAKRWTKYAAGQRLLLFLIKDARDKDRWRIIGGADEGEMPVLGEDVYPRVRIAPNWEPRQRFINQSMKCIAFCGVHGILHE